MVPDVTLRRCTVRVVRRGGWSWGREPRQLVNDVVRALPALLAAELQRYVPDEAEGEISAPLRVDIRTSLRELREWARSAAGRSESGSAAVAAGAPDGHPPHSNAVSEALRRALAAARLAERFSVPKPRAARSVPTSRAPEPQECAAVLLQMLVTFRAANTLEALLRTLRDELVQAWHRVLFETLVPEIARDETRAARRPPGLESWALRAADAPAIECMRLRLLAAAELAAEAGAEASPGATCAAVEAAIPLKADGGISRRVVAMPSVLATGVRATPGFETRVASALPFLLLGPLHRIGWLDLLHSTMSGADLVPALPDLAIALATKVLPEPERGWRRTPASLRAAATFAGDAQPRPDADLVALARVAAPLMPALDALVRRSLLDGRSKHDTLLVCAAGDLRLVVDPPGVFLVAHAAEAEALAAPLSDAHSPVFVPEEDADARMLAALDTAGVTFVTPARPVRGERWTAIPGTRAPRLFSNRPMRRIVPPPAQAAQRARDTWRAFENRPLPGRPTDHAFDRSLSMAAALALATMAWELWRSREPTDPLLALERFGDLDGTVRFEPHQVRVRLPLGKRFRDLKEGGLLEDIPRVPWLDFRTVVFAGG